MIDHSRAVADLAQYPGLKVVSVLANGVGAPTNSGLIAVDDVLVVSGDEELVTRYALDQWLAVVDARSADQAARSIFERNQGAAEVVVPPRSRLIGARVHPGKVLWGGSVVVLAVRRQGRDQAGKETKIAVGDSLLVEGRWDALDEAVAGHDVLVVDSPEQIRRQVVPMGRGSRRALMILAGMVLLLAWGAVPAVLAGLFAAGAMIAARVLTVEQAYDGVGWTTVILVAGMFPLSTAIRISGAGQDVGSLLVHIVGNAGPYGLLIGLFIVTVAFGQLISNTATALVMIPIAVSAAAQMHVSARPILFSLCVACATSFLTPVATPANLMVSGPAGYRFTDFWRLGIPLVGLFFVVATVWVPLIWRF
jgi:di/tricarboxylate transporter